MPMIKSRLLSLPIQGSTFGFSATRLEDLGASEYTLVVLSADDSGSVSGFVRDIERCIKDVVKACHQSPRADNPMVRFTRFASSCAEVHGFKPLATCQPSHYDKALQGDGMTRLYDATFNAVESVVRYAEDLHRGGFAANGIVFVLTDGMDNMSSATAKQVAAALTAARKAETLESLISILVGVNVKDAQVSRYLQTFADEGGFTQYVELEGADAGTLARLAAFVQKSILQQSMLLGTGQQGATLRF